MLVGQNNILYFVLHIFNTWRTNRTINHLAQFDGGVILKKRNKN